MSNVPPGAIPVNDPSLIGGPVELPFDIFDTAASTTEDPELASQQSTSFLSGLKAERPQIEPGGVRSIELPGGWLDKAGERHTEAFVRELTGVDEERLAKINVRDNPAAYLRGLLSAVESIGGFPVADEMLNELLVGDREMLILGVRIATYGNELPVHLVCPVCSEEMDIAVELEQDVPVRHLDEPERRAYDVELRGGRTAKVRPLTAAGQDAVLQDRKASVAKQKTITLEQCVISIDGLPANYQTVLNLGMADRETLLDFLADMQPGPDYEGVSVPCSGCGGSFPLTLSLADLFRP